MAVRFAGVPPRGVARHLGVQGPRCRLLGVDPSVPETTPTAEKPALSDAERVERLKLLAERLRDPEGLDHEALAQVEQLTEDGK
jgi:hypothetical protein